MRRDPRITWLQLSGCSVDGWEETTEQGQNEVRKQEMTLVVLKMIFASKDSESKISEVVASLMLEKPQNTNDMADPEVQAWAPFHKTERWNKSNAQHKKTSKKVVSLKAGHPNVDTSATGVSNARSPLSEPTSTKGGRTPRQAPGRADDRVSHGFLHRTISKTKASRRSSGLPSSWCDSR